MTASQWFDLAVIAVAFIAAVSGWRSGAVGSLMSFVGVVLGAVAGVLLAPHIVSHIDGARTKLFIALFLILGLVVVGGLCELDTPAGVLRNSAVILDADGLRAVYRKAHLWDREQLVFDPGQEPPPVVDTPHGRVATMVCYDVEFPEWVRLPALAGADLLCVPTNWPREPRPADERPAEVTRVQANASVNRMFIAACDRAGDERGVQWVSGTVIVGPDGYPLAGPVCQDRSVTVTARCRLSEAREKRTSERNDALNDRRPGLYEPVSH